MKNTTIGVDTSTSLPSKECPNCNGTGERTYRVPSPTNVAEDIEKKEKCDFCEGCGFIYDAGKAIVNSGPATPFLAQPQNVGVVCTVVNSIVTPSLQILLASVLGTVDASVPNKEQNKAIKHLLRKQFDDAYLNIQRLSYPDMNLGASGGEYYLTPNPTAFAQGTIRQ
jgi:hypothetical protein